LQTRSMEATRSSRLSTCQEINVNKVPMPAVVSAASSQQLLLFCIDTRLQGLISYLGVKIRMWESCLAIAVCMCSLPLYGPAPVPLCTALASNYGRRHGHQLLHSPWLSLHVQVALVNGLPPTPGALQALRNAQALMQRAASHQPYTSRLVQSKVVHSVLMLLQTLSCTGCMCQRR
jgi:hypothetical protein